MVKYETDNVLLFFGRGLSGGYENKHIQHLAEICLRSFECAVKFEAIVSIAKVIRGRIISADIIPNPGINAKIRDEFKGAELGTGTRYFDVEDCRVFVYREFQDVYDRRTGVKKDEAHKNKLRHLAESSTNAGGEAVRRKLIRKEYR